MRGMLVEQTHAERTEDAVVVVDNKDKDKKKKRRSNRRSKQFSSLSASSSVNEPHVEESIFSGRGSALNFVTSNEQRLPGAPKIAFISLPTLRINGQPVVQEGGILQNQQIFPSDDGETTFSKSCPERIAYEESMSSFINENFLLSHQTEFQAPRKYFASHWSTEVVTSALEKGDAFKALFRVNAYNQLEAYCKIDGVPTDILISGFAAQNRAVEGDIVVIRVDPLSCWTKMKGSTGTPNNSAMMDDCNLLPGVAEFSRHSCKGKDKVDVGHENVNCRNCSLLPEQWFHYENGSYLSQNGSPELIGPTGHSLNRDYHSMTDHSGAGCSGELSEAVSGMEMLCAMVSSFLSKRPTGRVVAIIERSSRRDTVVGFLSIKQWVSHREGYKRDTKKNKHVLSSSNHEYMPLTPTDPKLPKMMVPVTSLPDCMKKRLEDGDATVEMELVAAQIVEWKEENNVPVAHVMHIFGRGEDVESQISAILFENAIHSYEFSAEALSCLPHVPWEVPQEEFKHRRDLRELCVFTIDPASARDLDDALSVEMLSGGIFRVGVHIADVSYFVAPDTTLDIESQIRSTSVYLLQQKLPMLPALLSENLGSLNSGIDKLAFSIFWDINPAGEVIDRWIGRTIIRSCCRLSYEHAQDIIDGLIDMESISRLNNGWPQLHGKFDWFDVMRSVKSLHEISKILKENRFNDGALSLESPKVVFLFDEDGNPYDSVLCGRKDSNFLVEEFMLLANKTAAEVITRAYPSSALLRRHPEPNLRKLKEFKVFCNKHGLDLDISSSGQLHQSIERIRRELKNDSMLFDILISYASKPMQLAAYFCSGDLKDTENKGHYALALPLYTHFTSPLRRYPDIVVHRTLAAAIVAEEMYLEHKKTLQKLNGEGTNGRCFTSMCFDRDAVESHEAQEALSAAASKYRVPCTEVLADVAAYCNERKLASRHAEDAIYKLYMWVLLKKKQFLFSEARVLGLGPRFMSIYIQQLAIERRIYYDEVEGLTVEWLDVTSTLVLSVSANNHLQRRGGTVKCRKLKEVALVISPYDLERDVCESGESGDTDGVSQMGVDVAKSGVSDMVYIEPAFPPLTVRLLSTIPVALHAVGGNDGPLDIGVRLYMSSYFR